MCLHSDMASHEGDDVALQEVSLFFSSTCSFIRALPVKLMMRQRLKSALWLAVGRIVDEETIKLGVDATPQFIGALTELVWAQIGTCHGD